MSSIRKDKYFLPLLNWTLFTVICAIIVLYFLGILYSLVTVILSTILINSKSLATNTIQFFVDSFKNFKISTHIIILLLQLIALSICFSVEQLRIKLWQTITELIREK